MIPGARLIILGRQGAGKGTQCVRLSRHFVVPHISTGDLFRAQGYVHAQDRFWEMDFRRHVTAGRVAELFGEDEVVETLKEPNKAKKA